jgi:hypothetical protein
MVTPAVDPSGQQYSRTLAIAQIIGNRGNRGLNFKVKERTMIYVEA